MPDAHARAAAAVLEPPFATTGSGRLLQQPQARLASIDIPFWNRLSVRLTALTAAITLTLGFIATWMGITEQHEMLLSEVVRGAGLLSDAIKGSTHHAMLSERKDEAYLIMQTIGRQDAIESVRIFNDTGKVTFSTDASEVGTVIDKTAESCNSCHASDQPIERLDTPSRARTYRKGDHEVLAMVTPIYNEPSCSTAACHAHPPENRVLGVIDVGISLEQLSRSEWVSRRNQALVGAAAALLMIGALVFVARRLVSAPIERLVEETERIASGDLDHECPVRTADEVGVLSASFNHMTWSLRKAQGELRHLTERLEHKVEERTAALRTAQSQLIQAEKLTSLGQLAASVAHEINNPLAGILTYAKLVTRTLKEQPEDPATIASTIASLALIERETHRCSTIVRNLLDFARQREPTLREVDLDAAVEEALSLVAHQLAIQQVKVVRYLGPVPAVQADFAQMRQAFVNIIMNACDAMPKGGRLTVTSRSLPAEKMVEVLIGDTGVGIAPELLTKVIEPFYTTKEKGTGLGLSVVYGIVERHGGRLELKSKVGEGTTVSIRLPIAGTWTGGKPK